MTSWRLMAVPPDHGCQGSSLTPGIPSQSERPPPSQSVTKTGDDSASSQYTRELLFSSVVDLMSLVVCGVKPSVRSAYLASLGEISASLTAVYEKLQGIEPSVCRGLVRDTAGRLQPLVRQLDATLPDLVPGYRA